MKSVVQLTLLSDKSFHMAYEYLDLETSVLLGEDEEGHVVLDDLVSMRHLLIAGACGSGKTVCINSMIVSMLLGCSSEKIKFIMIDPKKTELGLLLYNNPSSLGHLIRHFGATAHCLR